MKQRLSLLALGLALTVATAVVPALPASADEVIVVDNGVPAYTTWQPSWERWEYDHHHVILGSVTNFAPYRLQLVRRDGVVQTIDLKNGTVILPTGATPMNAERVAVVGYYSHGTFIANRVIIRA